MRIRSALVAIIILIIIAAQQSCKEENSNNPTGEIESELTRNPLIDPAKPLKAYFQDSPNFSVPIYNDSIIYDGNRVKYTIPQDRFSYKYYENKILAYYNWNDLTEDELLFTYTLNTSGYPVEIVKEMSDYDFYGPHKTSIFYEGNFISYTIEVWEDRIDSTIYYNDGSNIISSIGYRDNEYYDRYNYEHDNKINPYRGYILGQHFLVDRFMNHNNTTQQEWRISIYRFVTNYTYTYDGSDLPLTKTRTYIENNTSYIKYFYYTYY